VHGRSTCASIEWLVPQVTNQALLQGTLHANEEIFKKNGAAPLQKRVDKHKLPAIVWH